MKICVLGGAGFIGSHVADRLSELGHDVCILDRKKSQWLRPDQSQIIGDITDKVTINDALSGIDVVYNFAAIADIDAAVKSPAETVSINILGTVNLLLACKENGVKRYMHASTVYVNSREGGFYRCSKRAAEEYIEEFNSVYGLDYTILRYGSLYGPRSDKSNGVYRIVRNAVENKIIKLTSHPESIREYIHVSDAATASVEMLDTKYRNQSVVLTGQEPMLVKDLLEMVREILNIKSEITINVPHEKHYIRTPYAYLPKPGKKYIPSFHYDLGQGLLELIAIIDDDVNKIGSKGAPE